MTVFVVEYGQITIAAASGKQWAPYALPQLNCLAMKAGYGVVGSYIGEAPGPGEILLNRESIRDVHELGRRLVRVLQAGETTVPAPGIYTHCPMCYSTHFEIESVAEVVCAMCRAKGRMVVQDGKVVFEFGQAGLAAHRFTPAAKAAHPRGWIKYTGPIFQSHFKEIQELRQPYKDMGIPWLTPPA